MTLPKTSEVQKQAKLALVAGALPAWEAIALLAWPWALARAKDLRWWFAVGVLSFMALVLKDLLAPTNPFGADSV